MSHRNAMYRKPSSGCICKGNYICTLMLISALFTISKIWIHSKCSSIDEWIKKNVMLFSFIHSSNTHTHTHTHKIQPFVTIWIWRILGKWNKLGTEKQLVHDIMYTWNLKSDIEAQSRIVVARSWGQGEMGRRWSQCITFQLWKMNKFQRPTV